MMAINHLHGHQTKVFAYFRVYFRVVYEPILSPPPSDHFQLFKNVGKRMNIKLLRRFFFGQYEFSKINNLLVGMINYFQMG